MICLLLRKAALAAVRLLKGRQGRLRGMEGDKIGGWGQEMHKW